MSVGPAHTKSETVIPKKMIVTSPPLPAGHEGSTNHLEVDEREALHLVRCRILHPPAPGFDLLQTRQQAMCRTIVKLVGKKGRSLPSARTTSSGR